MEEIFSNLQKEFAKRISTKKLEIPYAGAGLNEIFGNLKYIRGKGGNVNHITGHVNYLAFSLRNTVLTIHDVGSFFNGNKIHNFIIKIFWFWLPALLVKRITVISNFSKKELVGHIPFAANKIVVVHNPVNDSLRFTPKAFNKLKPVILHIGTKPNKNLERTIAALEGINCMFLIIGTLSEAQLELLKQYRIDYTNKRHIPFSEIKAAYEECDMVSFVSLYEGFGMPVIEAQAVGRPVITSNCSSIPEVAGNSTCMVNPEDVEKIREGISKVIENEKFRQGLIERGRENIKRFQIGEIAAQYLRIYKEIANV